MYDRMVTEYSKRSKEELIQEIMALEEIECSDRCFANQCEAGATIYNINELFSALKELKAGFTYEKAAKVYELIEIAESSWNYVKNGIAEINNDLRCTTVLEDFKNKVAKATDSNDSIWNACFIVGGADLKRQNINRKNNMMETRIDGINEFAKETVSNLLKKYPDIDFYDLMFQFEMQFRHEYSKAMLKETSE